MPISKRYRAGITDLFLYDDTNIPVLMQLAKNVTKSVCEINSEREALDLIFEYMDNIHVLLSKRHVTKELLFKYLHTHVKQKSTDFSKSDIIKHIVRYWNSLQQQPNADVTETKSIVGTIAVNSDKPESTKNDEAASFPINLLARKFSEWFFDNFNKNNLKIEDFWPDAQLHMRTIASDGIDEQICDTAEESIQALMNSKRLFGFHFNPNLTHDGVQGRMDPHGLVLVLSCGTLHTEDAFVGVFECVFSVLRDPFNENNWKPKQIKCILRSEALAHVPSLACSESLTQALTLPTPNVELT